jgi:hypothetical protein
MPKGCEQMGFTDPEPTVEVNPGTCFGRLIPLEETFDPHCSYALREYVYACAGC